MLTNCPFLEFFIIPNRNSVPITYSLSIAPNLPPLVISVLLSVYQFPSSNYLM